MSNCMRKRTTGVTKDNILYGLLHCISLKKEPQADNAADKTGCSDENQNNHPGSHSYKGVASTKKRKSLPVFACFGAVLVCILLCKFRRKKTVRVS